ncbi:hypothetical protein SBY92_001397 [Candida maltosa Xu316]|uniref:Uncharacterized protein n=1 Tax=Candida maltosa (strain Xu316) TaxID=1245528 RepID=M3JEI9_CANMX|nr:hypothetical protein G210_2079 [Candida maltosa Xu316]
MTQYLSKDSLFLKIPTEPLTDTIHVKDIYDEITSIATTDHKSAIYDSIINKTYYLLKSSTTSSLSLKLWLIRLTCHLFNNQLNYAKKEAINLNNTLYLNENPNTSTGSQLASMTTPGGNNPTTTVYPLPKNNQLLMIDFKLLILLLRLKNLPNLNLINELYKLIYQIRLKNNNTSFNETALSDDFNDELKLLSFDNIVILLITKNYLTLLNFLNQLINQLQEEDKHGDDYYSNICLLYLLVSLTVYHRQKKDLHLIIEKNPKFSTLWDDKINQFSKNALKYAIQNVSPIISAPVVTENQIVCESLMDLVGLIKEEKINNRILCAMMGIWDLSIIYHTKFQLSDNDGTLLFGKTNNSNDIDTQELSDEELINKSYDELSNQWCNYIHKVYGLE